MSKKILILIQTLFFFGSLGKVYAENFNVNVYEHGRPVGTMTIPAQQYIGMADKMKGTGMTFQIQPRPDAAERQAAAQQRMDEWKKQNEQRHNAALAQQEKWKQDFERRHAAAQNGFDAWKAAR